MTALPPSNPAPEITLQEHLCPLAEPSWQDEEIRTITLPCSCFWERRLIQANRTFWNCLEKRRHNWGWKGKGGHEQTDGCEWLRGYRLRSWLYSSELKVIAWFSWASDNLRARCVLPRKNRSDELAGMKSAMKMVMPKGERAGRSSGRANILSSGDIQHSSIKRRATFKSH